MRPTSGRGDAIGHGLDRPDLTGPGEYSFPGRAVWCPPTDVFRTDDAVVVRLELPGVRVEDVQVRISGGELIVWGHRRPPVGPRPRRIDRMEIAFGPFERLVPLPEPVVADSAHAELGDGLLEVILPLAEAEAGAPTLVRAYAVEIFLSIGP